MASSVAPGYRFGLLTVAGTSAAMVPQLIFTCLGLTALLGALAGWFEWLRWVGVVYLVFLGVQTWRASALAADLSAIPPQPRSARAIFLRGFLVSLSNPKTLFFYGAFFPQFLTVEPGLGAAVRRSWPLPPRSCSLLLCSIVRGPFSRPRLDTFS